MSSDVLPSVPLHPTEDLLEEYSFGRISEPALGPLEEHLLMCSQCTSQLAAIDEYRALMKSGIAAFERERARAFAASPRFAFPKFPGTLNMLLAAAILVIFACAIAWRMYRPAAEVAEATTVRLIALRGGEPDGSAHARSGRRLQLVTNRMDLPPSLFYRLEIFSSSGRRIWNGITRVAGQDVSADVDARFSSGVYWVRLYSGDKPLREFGLHID
jgi:hypothetical protein